METVVPPPADAELHILTEWGEAADSPRKRRAAVLSILVHVAAVVTLFTLPKAFFVPPPRTAQVQITPLIEPLTELTQNTPAKGKLNKEFDATEMHPRPRIQVPMGLPSVTMPQPAVPKPAPPLPEPPKVEAAVKDVPKTRSGKIMRRVIKAKAMGLPTGDVSALANPDAVDAIPLIT